LPKNLRNLWFEECDSFYKNTRLAIKEVLYAGESSFQEILILNTFEYEKVLVLDGDFQSSEKDEYVYHEALVHPAVIAHPKPQTVLILGGGEGATLREVVKYPDIYRVVMVDIDEKVVKLCQQFLPSYSSGAFSDKRVKLLFDDARKYVSETEERFDVIISDLTEPFPDSPSYFLCTQEFYEQISHCLNENGIFVTQASRLDCLNWVIHSLISNTIKQVFKEALSYYTYVPSFGDRWSFKIASKRERVLTALTPQLIESRINQRLGAGLKFYDGITHQGMFSLSKDIREKIDSQTLVLKDANPQLLKEIYQKKLGTYL